MFHALLTILWATENNCKNTCNGQGICMEIDNDGRQKEMDKILRELMEDDIGKKLKKKVMDWK